MSSLAAFEVDRQAIRAGDDRLGLGPQVEGEAHVLQLLRQDDGTGRVHLPGQQPGEKLHHDYLQAQFAQAVAGLEPQEAAADQYHGLGSRRRFFDPVGIGQGPQGEDPGGVRPWDRRDKGVAAGGQEELVERETLPLVSLHKFLGRVDLRHPGVQIEVDMSLVIPALLMQGDLVRRLFPRQILRQGGHIVKRPGLPGKDDNFAFRIMFPDIFRRGITRHTVADDQIRGHAGSFITAVKKNSIW